jgi:hypothetical protein
MNIPLIQGTTRASHYASTHQAADQINSPCGLTTLGSTAPKTKNGQFYMINVWSCVKMEYIYPPMANFIRKKYDNVESQVAIGSLFLDS